MTGLSGFYSKYRGACLRLALIHAVASNPQVERVPIESIQAAIAQIEYFKGQAAKAIVLFNVGVGTVGKGDYDIWKCQEEIKRKISKGDINSKRQLQRSSGYDDSVFNKAWSNLLDPLRIAKDKHGNFQIINQEELPGSSLAVTTDIPTTYTSEDPPPVAA